MPTESLDYMPNWSASVNKTERDMEIFNGIRIMGSIYLDTVDEALKLRDELLDKGVATAAVLVSDKDSYERYAILKSAEDLSLTEPYKYYQNFLREHYDVITHNGYDPLPESRLSFEVFADRDQLVEAGVPVPMPLDTSIALQKISQENLKEFEQEMARPKTLEDAQIFIGLHDKYTIPKDEIIKGMQSTRGYTEEQIKYAETELDRIIESHRRNATELYKDLKSHGMVSLDTPLPQGASEEIVDIKRIFTTIQRELKLAETDTSALGKNQSKDRMDTKLQEAYYEAILCTKKREKNRSR